jgi:hypothetical protein
VGEEEEEEQQQEWEEQGTAGRTRRKKRRQPAADLADLPTRVTNRSAADAAPPLVAGLPGATKNRGR